MAQDMTQDMVQNMDPEITFSIHPPGYEGADNFMGGYDGSGTCVDCLQANCDKCFRFANDGTCMCIVQGFHGLPTPEANNLDDPAMLEYYNYPLPLGIDIPNHSHQHHFATAATTDSDQFHFMSSSGPSSEGSYISTPPSPNPGGVDIPDNHPQDWSDVLAHRGFRDRSQDSRSSAHGDEASIGPDSQASGSPQEIFAAGPSSSYGSHSSHLSNFNELTINSDVKYDMACLPSPDHLSPHLSPTTNIGRSSSFNGVRRGHSRSISNQYPEETDHLGRGRGLGRTRSVPSSCPGSRRHSPYAPQRQNMDSSLEASPSTSPHRGSSAESLQDPVVKDVVTTEKTKVAAEKRRKNPAPWMCNLCGATFTTKFKRDRHVLAHSAIKPFMCTFEGCGKTFSSQSDTMRHEKTSRMHERQRVLALEASGHFS